MSGFEYLASAPAAISSMVVHNGVLFVAAGARLYRLEEQVFMDQRPTEYQLVSVPFDRGPTPEWSAADYFRRRQDQHVPGY